jgi:hypothetical protein
MHVLAMSIVLSQMKAWWKKTRYDLPSHETYMYICGPYGDNGQKLREPIEYVAQ